MCGCEIAKPLESFEAKRAWASSCTLGGMIRQGFRLSSAGFDGGHVAQEARPLTLVSNDITPLPRCIERDRVDSPGFLI